MLLTLHWISCTSYSSTETLSRWLRAATQPLSHSGIVRTLRQLPDSQSGIFSIDIGPFFSPNIDTPISGCRETKLTEALLSQRAGYTSVVDMKVWNEERDGMNIDELNESS